MTTYCSSTIIPPSETKFDLWTYNTPPPALWRSIIMLQTTAPKPEGWGVHVSHRERVKGAKVKNKGGGEWLKTQRSHHICQLNMCWLPHSKTPTHLDAKVKKKRPRFGIKQSKMYDYCVCTIMQLFLKSLKVWSWSGMSEFQCLRFVFFVFFLHNGEIVWSWFGARMIMHQT